MLCDVSSNDITVTLPATSGLAGRHYYIKLINYDGVNRWDVEIDGNGAETIDGSATFDLLADDVAVHLVATNTTWHILGIYSP